MSRNKCRNCELVNAVSDVACRRCGMEIGKTVTKTSDRRGPREAAKRSSWLYTLLFLALVGWAANYFLTGVERSYNDVRASEGKSVANQPKQPSEGLSNRTEVDQKRTGSYKNAVQNSQGLSESQKHNDDVKKLMDPQKQ